VQAFLAEVTEAFLEAHLRAFESFGGVPGPILYVKRHWRGANPGKRGAAENASLFRVEEPLPVRRQVRPLGKGNNKGKVENPVDYARRNFMVLISRAGMLG
jgi:transposase